jgi:hypothetical protein
MEEPSLHAVVRSGSDDHSHSGGKPADDALEGNVDDPPPIPSASSSKQLTEKSAGESRLDQSLDVTNEDVDINNCAHTLPPSDVAAQLGTSL